MPPLHLGHRAPGNLRHHRFEHALHARIEVIISPLIVIPIGSSLMLLCPHLQLDRLHRLVSILPRSILVVWLPIWISMRLVAL